jgi:hypothetical protein
MTTSYISCTEARIHDLYQMVDFTTDVGPEASITDSSSGTIRLLSETSYLMVGAYQTIC